MTINRTHTYASPHISRYTMFIPKSWEMYLATFTLRQCAEPHFISLGPIEILVQSCQSAGVLEFSSHTSVGYNFVYYILTTTNFKFCYQYTIYPDQSRKILHGSK